MKINSVKFQESLMKDKCVALKAEQLHHLIVELNKRELPDAVVETINRQIERINRCNEPLKPYLKEIKGAMAVILLVLQKEVDLVMLNYYRNYWFVLGMPVFGLPLGICVGCLTSNMVMIGLYLPVGMILGLALGSYLDKRALAKGRELSLELDIN